MALIRALNFLLIITFVFTLKVNRKHRNIKTNQDIEIDENTTAE